MRSNFDLVDQNNEGTAAHLRQLEVSKSRWKHLVYSRLDTFVSVSSL